MKRSFYGTSEWRRLARWVKLRDAHQCQICGDRKGAPHCVLHAHHIVPRSQGGLDDPINVITLCDLCHATVTARWHKPWFGQLTEERKRELMGFKKEFDEFLRLDPDARTKRQAAIWQQFGKAKAPSLLF